MKMLENTLRRIITFACNPIASLPNRMQKVIGRDGGMT
jgi:hypothetical protein